MALPSSSLRMLRQLCAHSSTTKATKKSSRNQKATYFDESAMGKLRNRSEGRLSSMNCQSESRRSWSLNTQRSTQAMPFEELLQRGSQSKARVRASFRSLVDGSPRALPKSTSTIQTTFVKLLRWSFKEKSPKQQRFSKNSLQKVHLESRQVLSEHLELLSTRKRWS